MAVVAALLTAPLITVLVLAVLANTADVFRLELFQVALLL